MTGPEQRRALSRNPRGEIDSYPRIPFLKAPVWKWEIAGYFFLGGLSAGSLALGRIARRFGDDPELVARASAVALAALLPCPVLLIKDLGDPKRFHHMLRIFKAESPMSVGSWTLVVYSGAAASACAIDWIPRLLKRPAVKSGALDLLVDVVALPASLLLAGYTGVLLSGTANPLWTRNIWLGPLFTSSAIHAGAGALQLAGGIKPASSRALQVIENASGVAQASTLAGYVLSLGTAGSLLTSGKYAPHLLGGSVCGGLIAPVALRMAADRAAPTAAARLRAAACVAGLAGGLALRWAIVFAGHLAARESRPGSSPANRARPARPQPVRSTRQ